MINTENSGHSDHWLWCAFSCLVFTGEPDFLLFSIHNKFLKRELSFYCSMTSCMKMHHPLWDRRITWLSSSCALFKISVWINMHIMRMQATTLPSPALPQGWHCSNKCLKLDKCSLSLAEYGKFTNSSIWAHKHFTISQIYKCEMAVINTNVHSCTQDGANHITAACLLAFYHGTKICSSLPWKSTVTGIIKKWATMWSEQLSPWRETQWCKWTGIAV